MPVGLSDRFDHYLPPTAGATKSAITSGLVVLDTNVLLSLYRFAPQAREELLSAMERLAERLWIPDQVALEFHRNRLNVMADHDMAYSPVIDTLARHQNAIGEEVAQRLRELANRVALSDEDRNRLLRLLSTSLSPLRNAVVELRNKHGLADPLGEDPILSRLQRLFQDRVGAPLADDEQSAAEAEAARRIGNKEPPGYKDASSCGDYLVWRQTLAEAAKRSLSWLLFVTSDVKEDWYYIIKGRTVSARPELVQEAHSEANTQLVMLNTQAFLYHARDYLNATVSAETLRQAEVAQTDSEKTRIDVSATTATHRKTINLLRTDIARLNKRINRREEAIEALREAIRALAASNDPADSAKASTLRRQLNHAEATRPNLTQRRNDAERELAFLISGQAEHVGLDESF
jgi:hypothetical protein